MEFDWDAKAYRDIVNSYLGVVNERRPRGAIKALSEAIGCHSTFIALVLKGSADFSLEQAMKVCEHYRLSSAETEFFICLLQRDRAGTLLLKSFFQKQLNQLLENRMDIERRLDAKGVELFQKEITYFGNWTYQAVHAVTQMPGQNIASISKLLKVPEEEVQTVLSFLENMGLVQKEKSCWVSTNNFLHLSKDSNLIKQLHLTWKTKLLADLQSGRPIEGTHYSGTITISEADYRNVREVLIESLGKIRTITKKSSSEKVCILSMDCYEL